MRNWGYNTFFDTCDTFLTLLPLSPCPDFVVSVVQFGFCSIMISFLCKGTQKELECGLFLGRGDGRRAALTHVLVDYRIYINIYMCIEIVIIYISIYVSSMKLFLIDVFQKIVCRCFFSLCAIGSWDLVGQCLHSGVCVSRCVYCL